MTENQSPESTSGDRPKEVEFTYRKGRYFRVIHVDGAHGGISPDSSSIVMSVFNERKPIPKKEIYDIDEAGGLRSPPKVREQRIGIFREVEASLVMDYPTARMVYLWLGERLKQQEAVFKKIEEQLMGQDKSAGQTE